MTHEAKFQEIVDELLQALQDPELMTSNADLLDTITCVETIADLLEAALYIVTSH